MAMRGRGGKAGGGPSADLLVCFPSRAHLALMPKSITSPSRPSEAAKRRHRHHYLRARSTRNLDKARQLSLEAEEEPTSPKVTCAGKIKVSPLKPRMPGDHGSRWVKKQVEGLEGGMKKETWLETLGIKKDIMHLLHALQGLRFSMRCFSSFAGATDYSSEDEKEDDQEQTEVENGSADAARTIFSKWFMFLDENPGTGGEEKTDAPPPNALLLMRCRSAPAKGCLDRDDKIQSKNTKQEKGRLVLKSYSPDFTEAAKETWIVSSFDPLARSRSCR